MEKVVDIRNDEYNDEKCIITLDIDGKISERSFDFDIDGEQILEYTGKYKRVLNKRIKKTRKNSSKNTPKRKFIAHICMIPYYLLMGYATLGFASVGIGSLSIASLSSALALVGGAMFVHNNSFFYTTPEERKKIQNYKDKKSECDSIEKIITNMLTDKRNYETSRYERENAQEIARKKQQEKDFRRQETQRLKREKEELLKVKQQELEKREAIKRANYEKRIILQNRKVLDEHNIKVQVIEENLKEINSDMTMILNQIVELENEALKRGIPLERLKKDYEYVRLTSQYENLNNQMQLLSKALEEAYELTERNIQDINSRRR